MISPYNIDVEFEVYTGEVNINKGRFDAVREIRKGILIGFQVHRLNLSNTDYAIVIDKETREIKFMDYEKLKVLL